MLLEMLQTKQPLNDIEKRREKITRMLSCLSSGLTSQALRSVSAADLQLLFRLYDEVFLDNWFQSNYSGELKFSLSGKMITSAGKTLCPKNIEMIRPEELVIEIRLGIDFFLRYGQQSGDNVVCGIKTRSALEALLLVFEHEICHVLEFLFFHKSSCKGKRFRTMANNIFGHTESYHKLPTARQLATAEFGLRPGDRVSFEYKDRRLTGIIQNLNKRATVLVPDRKGMLVDRRGARYTKYYVPLTRLQAC